EELLAELKGHEKNPSLDERREPRAVEVPEAVGTSQAWSVLESLATGAPGSGRRRRGRSTWQPDNPTAAKPLPQPMISKQLKTTIVAGGRTRQQPDEPDNPGDGRSRCRVCRVAYPTACLSRKLFTELKLAISQGLTVGLSGCCNSECIFGWDIR